MQSTGVPAEDAAGGALEGPSGPAPSVVGIELELPDAPPARFRLLWDEAPRTCAAVSAALPESAECFHAIYSGTVAAFLLEPEVVAPVENATTCLLPGELVFTHYDAGVRHGHLNALSEIYWAYDRYARPTVPGQFVPLETASVFATYEGSPEAWRSFAARCRRLRFDGTATIAVRTY